MLSLDDVCPYTIHMYYATHVFLESIYARRLHCIRRTFPYIKRDRYICKYRAIYQAWYIYIYIYHDKICIYIYYKYIAWYIKCDRWGQDSHRPSPFISIFLGFNQPRPSLSTLTKTIDLTKVFDMVNHSADSSSPLQAIAPNVGNLPT